MLVLAIETSLKSGSLSILQNGTTIYSSIFSEDVSMSQTLVSEIDKLIGKCKIDKSDLNYIAVSNGPGSLTGIRMGISVALGLSSALGISCLGVSLLEAISLLRENKTAITLLPSGNRKCYWQFFNDREASPIGLVENEEINNLLKEYSESSHIIHSSLMRFIDGEDKTLLILPQNTSELIGRYSLLKFYQVSDITALAPNPLYFGDNLFKKSNKC